jgi:hypothetical protein
MNNLERKLIELTFPTLNADALMEITSATPNGRVAIEILCGIYIEPVFVQDKLTSDDVARTFMSYDKWNEQITYKYQEEETVYEYFPKSVDKGSITLDNYKSLACNYNSEKDPYRHSIKTGVIKVKTNCCSVKDWDKLKDNKFELSDAPVADLPIGV